MKLKVLFLVSKLDSPSTRWRVLQFVPHFQEAGVACTVDEIPAGAMAKLAMAKRASGHDIVVLQRKLLPRLVSNRIRRNAKRLVFEFDDSITLKKSEEGVAASPTRERRFRRIIREADAVITTNAHLAEEARRIAPDPARVRVLPSVIDLQRWTTRGPAKRGWPYVIGWMGSESDVQHLEIVRSALQKVCRRHKDLALRAVTNQPLDLPGVRIELRPYAADREVQEIQAFDMAIAPMVEDLWTRGKVSTRVLAYGAAGIPVVASDVGSHRLYLRDGETGFLAGTLTQWEEKIEKLLADPDLRDEMGRRAREAVEREYSLASMVPKYLELFRELAGLPVVH